jgi:transcriptional regulator with XRE-family HTH domain
MDKNNTLKNMIASNFVEFTFESDPAKIGETLSIVRRLNNFTLTDIQNKTGISYQHLSKYEKNTTKINIHNLIKILDALGYKLTLQATKKNNETK